MKQNVVAAKIFLFISFQTSRLKFFKIILFHFTMEPRTEIKKIAWATDGGGSGMKFFK